jgi:hypothetical protein
MGDINFGFIVSQLLHFSLLIAWIVLMFYALRLLQKADLPEGVRLIWVLLVIFVPLLGTLALLIVRPGLDKTKAINLPIGGDAS